MFGYINNNEIIISNPLTVNDIVYTDNHLRGMDATDREALSIYPVEETSFDENLQRNTGYVYSLINNEIVGTPTLVDIPASEIAPKILLKINNLRSTKLVETINYNGNVFDADATAAFNITSMITSIVAGMSLPVGFAWRSHNNLNIPFSIDDLKALGNVLLARNNAVYVASWTHKANIEQMLLNPNTTAQNIMDYDINQGW